MEKVLTENDRIRKAEEIYYRRKQGLASSQVPKIKEKKKHKHHVCFHFLLLLNLIVAVYAIQNRQYIFSETFLADADRFMQQDLKWNEKVEAIKQYFQKNMYVVEEENKQEVQATDTNGNASSSEEVEEKQEEMPAEENVSSISQMDIESAAAKENEFQWPLKGSITSYFGVRNSDNRIVTKYHTGIDIAAVTGTKIASSLSGKVIEVSQQGSYGNHVKIENENIITLYAHCNAIYVKEGDVVEKGQEIAEVGATGNATGPHLHFEIRKDGQYIDPLTILDVQEMEK